MQTIEEIVLKASEKKRVEDNVTEEKNAKVADEFINSLQPSIAQLLFSRSNHSLWMDFSFRLPSGGVFKAELNTYGNDKPEWSAWIFNPNLEACEFGFKSRSMSQAIEQAIYANNLKEYLAKKEIKI